MAVDEQTGESLAVEVSLNDKKDAQLRPPWLKAIDDDIEQVSADGAYDTHECYDATRKRNAKAIPPRKDAKIWQHGNKRAPHPRDQNLRLIRKQGRTQCKRLVNYHRRSLAETTMLRYQTFSAQACSRRFDSQSAELKRKCKALTKMIQLAKPDTYLVT